MAVADAEGLGALSMRRVAADLGVGTMSLYRYVPGKAELLDLMLDAVAALPADGLPEPGPDTGWRPALEALAHATWRLHQEHPWLLRVDQGRPLLGPNALDRLEYAVRALAGTGLADREKIQLLVALDGFVTGTARTVLNSARAEQRTGVSDADFRRAQEPLLAQAVRSGRYPALAGLDEDVFSGAPGDGGGSPAFTLGLAALLDGFAAVVADRAATAPAHPPEGTHHQPPPHGTHRAAT